MRMVRFNDERLPRALRSHCVSAVSASTSATPIVLVDGLSGAGKSTCARLIADAVRADLRVPARVLGPDSWYAGWEGLRDAQATTCDLLTALRNGRVGEYATWDWTASSPSETVAVTPGVVTIVEGCGVLTRCTRPLADAAIWVEAEGGEPVRYQRAIDRDGETYRMWWDTWARQDEARLEDDRPDDLADLVVLT